MKKIVLLILMTWSISGISQEKLDLAGKVKISTMDVSDSDSIVLWNSDGTLGVRQSSALNKIILNALANKNETFTSDTTGTVMDRDGHVYTTVKIGFQWWMAENLRTTKYSDGSAIDSANSNTRWTTDVTNGKWCWYEGDSTMYGVPYGKLYNWYAVDDSRGLCPSGWHVPSNPGDPVQSDSEWQTLVNYLSPDAGLKMKTTSGWFANNGTNTSGFSGLPGGGRRPNGSFFTVGLYGSWWSSSQLNTNNAWYRFLNYSNGNVNVYSGDNKELGFSVRCIRN